MPFTVVNILVAQFRISVGVSGFFQHFNKMDQMDQNKISIQFDVNHLTELIKNVK